MENNILVNGIIKFSNVDGPGNRYTIFLQGCNVRCIYCHNFETINFCNSCGSCIEVCEASALKLINNKVVYDKALCVDCDECIKTCKNSSSPKTKIFDIEELVQEIKKYEPFLRGITVSGGECTLQAREVANLFKRVKEETSLTCFVDTNGYFDIENEHIKELIDITDKFMIDIKAVENVEKIIGVSETNRNLTNLRYLLDINKVYEVRTVVTSDFEYFLNVLKTAGEIVKNYDVMYKVIAMRDKSIKGKSSLSELVPSQNDMDGYIDLLNEMNVKCSVK